MGRTVKWEELSRGEQAVLANFQEDIGGGYLPAFKQLIARGLVDTKTCYNTALGDQVIEDARRRGFIYGNRRVEKFGG